MWPHSDSDIDTDSDTDRSYQSGDDRRYFWLRSDYDYGRSRSDRRDQDEDDDESEPDQVAEDNALFDLAAEELTDLRQRVQNLLNRDAAREGVMAAQRTELEAARTHVQTTTLQLQATQSTLEATNIELEFTQRSLQATIDENLVLANKLVRSEACNRHLAQRLVRVGSFLCGKWVGHASDQLRTRQLTRWNRLMGWILVLMMGVMVRLVTRA